MGYATRSTFFAGALVGFAAAVLASLPARAQEEEAPASRGAPRSKEALLGELQQIDQEKRKADKKRDRLQRCVSGRNAKTGRPCRRRGNPSAAIIASLESHQLTLRRNEIMRALCREHREEEACGALRQELWRSKMGQYLRKNRIQFSRADFKRLTKLKEKGDAQAFQRLATSSLQKSFEQAGFPCDKHRTRHHCSEHCDQEHGRGFNMLKPACAAGCHADNKWFKPAFAEIGKWFHAAGKWIEKAAQDVGKEVEKLAKDPFTMICTPFLGPLCTVLKILGDLVKRTIDAKGDLPKALAGMFESLKKRVERFIKKVGKRFTALFRGLDDVFSMASEREIGSRVGKFAKTVFQEVKGVTREFHELLDMPGIIGEVVGAINGASIVGAVTPPVSLIAIIALGARKLMEWLVPKLILGLGDLYGEIEKLPSVVRDAAKMLIDFAKVIVPAAGGLLGSFLDERSKERVRALMRQIADVSGRVANGMKGALAVAEQVRTGTFEDVERALESNAQLPTKLTARDLGKIIGGLVELAGDQIWAKLEGALGNLLGKLFKLLDPLLDSARATLVGPVGSIPFVGGVLASVLNVGAGVLVTMAKDFIIGKILELAKKQLDRSLASMKRALEKELLRTKQNVAKTEKFTKLLKLVGDVVGEVSQVSRDLASGANGVLGVLSSLAATALDKFLLQGIRDAGLRTAVSRAVGEVVKQLGKPGSFNLKAMAASVLKKLGKAAAARLASGIQDPMLKGLATRIARGL